MSFRERLMLNLQREPTGPWWHVLATTLLGLAFLFVPDLGAFWRGYQALRRDGQITWEEGQW